MTQSLTLSFAPRMRPSEVRIRLCSGPHEITTVTVASRSGHSLREAPEALFCLGIYPASELGLPLRIDAPVDHALLARATEISGHYADWWPGCARVHAEAPAPEIPATAGAPGAALFFSGGVDSTFSLLEAAPRLSALITLLGVDVPLDDTTGIATLEETTRRTAQEHGLDAILLETDIRQKLHPYAGWVELHGAAMAAIGHLLTDHVDRVLIAASGNESAWYEPWGSHPGLDPLFGSPALQVEHHMLVDRFDKIARIAEDDHQLARLKVCTKTSLNCGTCSKCTFVLRALEILGRRDRARTFPPTGLHDGYIHVGEAAYLTEVVRLRNAARQAGRQDLVPALNASIGEFRRTPDWRRRLEVALKTRFRIARHRHRWRRAAS